MIKTETDKHQGNGAHDEDAQDRKIKPRTPLHPPMRNIAVWGPIAAVTFVAILVILGAWHRVSQRREEKEFVQRTTQLQVNVATAQRDAKPKELILPGTFDAFNQTTIFPRSNGYVKSWKVDIGDNVKAGQLLAEIEEPEVDQQLAQARAQQEIAKVTADRWRDCSIEKSCPSRSTIKTKKRTRQPTRICSSSKKSRASSRWSRHLLEKSRLGISMSARS